MNEADTRALLIDPKLSAAGWGVVPESRILREYAITDGAIKLNGVRPSRLKADYVLIYKNRKLAVIEAKSDELEVGEGVAQAKQYASKLQISYSFASNGRAIYQICLANGVEGVVAAFPSPQELWQLVFGDVNEWQAKFDAVPFHDMNGTKRPRFYQEIAINRVLEAVANGKQRLLLTLATGTGKTTIAAQIAWKLFATRWNLRRDGGRRPRILFLADRNNLAEQAFGGFSCFADDAMKRITPDDIRKQGQVPTNGSVFFAIFQTFMSGPNDSPYFGQYEADFFDFIIIDECHRGGANDQSAWRGILEYFKPAVQLGLTATPKRKDNADTYEYFGDPLYKYSLKEGIEDGFLTPFKVKRVITTMGEYVYNPADQVLEGEIEEGRIYDEKDYNKTIFIEDRERKLVKDMLSLIDRQQKTIIFCVDQSHAARVRDLVNQEVKPLNPDYCVRITADDGVIGDNYLKNFKDNEKTIPTIVTTSQKLTTGVDVHNIRNIVLMRPIENMISFKQIIGRGTRNYDGKYYFTIIDFYDAYHLFFDPEWDGEPIEPVISNPDDGPIAEPARPDDDAKADKPPREPKSKIVVKLSKDREKDLQSITETLYFDGKLTSATDFMEKLFHTMKLPEFFQSEAELRDLWSKPATRSELLRKLAEKGCAKEDLIKFQSLINAENSDLFDVLEYVSYDRKPPIPRTERVKQARGKILEFLDANQQEFINFILNNYEKSGVDELATENLGSALTSKYGSLIDAYAKLGEAEAIKEVFNNFQQHLYHSKMA